MTEGGLDSETPSLDLEAIPFESDPAEKAIQLEGSLFLHSAEVANLPAEQRQELQKLCDQFQETVAAAWHVWHLDGRVQSPFPVRMSRQTFAAQFLLRAGAFNPESYGEPRW